MALRSAIFLLLLRSMQCLPIASWIFQLTILCVVTLVFTILDAKIRNKVIDRGSVITILRDRESTRSAFSLAPPRRARVASLTPRCATPRADKRESLRPGKIK